MKRLNTLTSLLSPCLFVLFLAAGCGDNSIDPPPDADKDGIPDREDAFPNDSSENKDSDGDGVGDNKDDFPNDSSETTDSDSDGVGDNGDNCVNDANPGQADVDANGQGDACDAIRTVYEFTNDTYEAGSDSVSYTGQTARQMNLNS